MLTIGIAVAVVAFVIADIIAVQGFDFTAFNNSRASNLFTVAIVHPGSAGVNVQREAARGKGLRSCHYENMPAEKLPVIFQGRFLPA
jgi:hypothetical protein